MPTNNWTPGAALPSDMVRGKVGVVTVTYNSSGVLPEFLDSLKSQRYENFVVFAIDNASKDGSVTDLTQYADSRIRVIANDKNLGVAAANNQGIVAAISEGCEYILLLNNDVVFKADLFSSLIDGLKKSGGDMTAPFMYYHDRPKVIWAAGGKYQPLFGFRCFHLKEGETDDGQFCSVYPASHAPTCCVLLKREVFAAIGLMDERYFVYHDDTDFMLRAHYAGLKLFCLPYAKLWHKVSSLTGGESEFSIRYGTRNRAFMIVKFMGRFLSLPYRVMYRFLYLLRFITGRDSRQTLRLKLSSWREGERISTNWLPYRASRPFSG